MKGILGFLSCIIVLAVIVSGVSFGRLFFMGNSLRKDLEELESYNFEVFYHISGDSDILNMEQYETEKTPIFTKWFTSYIKKMEQGGSIYGTMHDGVYHAEAYAEGENQSSIDFYYYDESVFGVKKTLDYIIASVADETKLPISLLQKITPNGYVSLEQIKTVLGEKQETDGSVEEDVIQMNLMNLGKELIRELQLIIPTTVKDNYFQEQLDGADMSYCLAKTSLNGEKTEISVGITNEKYHKYIYIRMDDVYGKRGSTLEVLLHINVIENQPIEIPETISDGVINTLASIVSFINGLEKNN